MEKPGKSLDYNNQNSNWKKKLNTVLVFLVIISGAILIYVANDIPNRGSELELENELTGTNRIYDKGLKIRSIIPARESGIINGHEHIQNLELGTRWVKAMDRAGISTTVMLGSPDATFFLHPSGPFNKYEENNEELFLLVDKYPDRFIAFPTIFPYADNKLDLLENYISRGALGLKLFSGHHAVFYKDIGPLNLSSMYPVYEYCEQEHIPIIWHIHLGEEYLRNEFDEILRDFPNLIINVPHFMLLSIDLYKTKGQGRLRYYLDTYPNLYTDISFGYWVKDGLWRISNHTKEFREFMIEFQDRFTFGTDIVCTVHPRKDVEWLANITIGYRDILEKEHFNLTVNPDIQGDFNGFEPGTHNGLNLPAGVLNKIYYDNMIKFLNCRYYYEDLNDIINESDLTYEKSKSRANEDTKRHALAQSAKLLELDSVFIAIDSKLVQITV